MKVLFCTDGSKTSYDAISNFSKWFRDFSVDILSVSDMTYLPDSLLFDSNKYVLECKNSTNSIIEYTQNYLSEKNINVSGIIKLCGNAVDSILETELKTNYDYIVMGSNGKKGMQKWLGSVSQEVASFSKTNVFISKTFQDEKKILFPVTASVLSDNIIKTAISSFDFTDTEIYLITVYEMPDFLFLEGKIDSNWVSDVERQQQKAALQNLMLIEKYFMDEGVSIAGKTVTDGSASEKIIDFVNINKISTVMCGMRKRKSFSGLILSSVSRRVLENAPCDVIIYKEI